MYLFIAMSPKSYYFQLGTTPDLDAAYQKLKREKLVLTHHTTDNLTEPEATYFFDQIYKTHETMEWGWFRVPIKKFLNAYPNFIFYELSDKTYDPVEKYLREYPDAYLTGAAFVGRKLKQPTLLVNKNWRFRLLEPIED